MYIFKTNDDIPLAYFTARGSLSEYDFPRYAKGTVEDFTDSSGGIVEWKDFKDFDSFKAQNIVSIEVNGVNINDEIIEAAKAYGATVKFPLLYHIQFEFKSNPDWIYNWYPTTGTLSKQKTTDKFYRMQSLGFFTTVEDALNACK